MCTIIIYIRRTYNCIANKKFLAFCARQKKFNKFFMNYGTLILILYLQLLVAKSPLCGREGFVVHIEDKGLTLDWTATGKIPPNL